MEKQKEEAVNRSQQSNQNVGNKGIFSLEIGVVSRIKINLMKNLGRIL